MALTTDPGIVQRANAGDISGARLRRKQVDRILKQEEAALKEAVSATKVQTQARTRQSAAFENYRKVLQDRALQLEQSAKLDLNGGSAELAGVQKYASRILREETGERKKVADGLKDELKDFDRKLENASERSKAEKDAASLQTKQNTAFENYAKVLQDRALELKQSARLDVTGPSKKLARLAGKRQGYCKKESIARGQVKRALKARAERVRPPSQRKPVQPAAHSRRHLLNLL